MDKARIWEMVLELPEYKDGRFTEAQAEEVVDYLYVNQEKIFQDALKADITRELIRMMNRGEVEYDPETEKYRFIGPRP